MPEVHTLGGVTKVRHPLGKGTFSNSMHKVLILVNLCLLGAADEHVLPVVGGDGEEGGVGEHLGGLVVGSYIQVMEEHGGGRE